MWFDTRVRLAQITSPGFATSATPATLSADAMTVSQESQMSQAATHGNGHPDFEPGAVSGRFDAKTEHLNKDRSSRHVDRVHAIIPGEASCPKTWTGRIVSLAEWRNLTDWERHGPRGRVWNALTRKWE